jgi:glutaredoxin-like YruB-family protein
MAVTIYTTPSCGYCKVAKEFFRTQHISFTEYNVGSDQRRAEEMVRKSGQTGVPVIEVNGKIIVGFNKPELEKALKH